MSWRRDTNRWWPSCSGLAGGLLTRQEAREGAREEAREAIGGTPTKKRRRCLLPTRADGSVEVEHRLRFFSRTGILPTTDSLFVRDRVCLVPFALRLTSTGC